MKRDNYLISVRNEEGISLYYEPAQLFSRAVAWIIDFFVYSNAVLLLSFLVLILNEAFGVVDYFKGVLEYILLLAVFLIYWFYFTFFELYFKGKTPGKYITGIRVIDLSGLRLSFWQSMLRNIIRLVDMLPFGYLIGVVVHFFDPYGRRLGDIVSGTIVVKDDAEFDIFSDYLAIEIKEVADDLLVYRTALKRLPLRLLFLILSFVKERESYPLEKRAYVAYRLAEEVEKVTKIRRQRHISPELYLLYFVLAHTEFYRS